MKKRSLVEEALAEASPYLEDMEWVKRKVYEAWGTFQDPVRLLEAFRELIASERSPTRKTDLKIFLQYLERKLKEK